LFSVLDFTLILLLCFMADDLHLFEVVIYSIKAQFIMSNTQTLKKNSGFGDSISFLLFQFKFIMLIEKGCRGSNPNSVPFLMQMIAPLIMTSYIKQRR
ncbi:hypothetical protein T01_15888, partial [Trichinella spiralis]